MVKEYIENLILDTNEELERLQTQMKELLEELQSSQENQERLQREKNRDTNIFSPRSIQLGTDEKLAKAKEEVKKIVFCVVMKIKRMLSMRIFPIHLCAFIWMRESMR